jgi:hypothetical protein
MLGHIFSCSAKSRNFILHTFRTYVVHIYISKYVTISQFTHYLGRLRDFILVREVLLVEFYVFMWLESVIVNSNMLGELYSCFSS